MSEGAIPAMSTLREDDVASDSSTEAKKTGTIDLRAAQREERAVQATVPFLRDSAKRVLLVFGMLKVCDMWHSQRSTGN